MRVSVHPEVLMAALGDRFPALAATMSDAAPNPAVRVTTATHDSRLVEAGSLFCCIRGGAFDGHRFAAEAVGKGAVALLVDHVLPGIGVYQIVVSDTRKAMGPVTSALFGFPSERLVMIGITGTNGKTTTAHLLGEVLSAHGHSCRVIGTLTQKRTTPEASITICPESR